MNRKWLVIILLVFFSLAAGATLIVTSAMAPKGNPYVIDYKSCMDAGGDNAIMENKTICTFAGQIYYQ
jgi:hypothetical protein